MAVETAMSSKKGDEGMNMNSSELSRQESAVAFVTRCKDEGNGKFHDEDLEGARRKFNEGLERLSTCHKNKKSTRLLALEVALRSNLGLVLFKGKRYREAIEETTAALRLSRKHSNITNVQKNLYRRAMAKERSGDPEGARSDLALCLRYAEKEKKSNEECRRALARIEATLPQSPVKTTTPNSNVHRSQRAHMVWTLLQQSIRPRVGEAFCVVSYAWWDEWWRSLNGKNPSKVPPGSWNHSLTVSSSSYDAHDLWPVDRNAGEVLRPHLVRGYHYEVLPREVYAALRSWHPSSAQAALATVQRISSDNNLYIYCGKERERKCVMCNNKSRKLRRCSGCGDVHYCSQKCQSAHWPAHAPFCVVQKKRKGLPNLGNTCFLNAAVQCLAHVYPLSRYFLNTAKFEKALELAASNPLSQQGVLARAFRVFLEEQTPHALRAVTARHFGGRRPAGRTNTPVSLAGPQHDAQEFLAYLVDGLHEDLNRAHSVSYPQTTKQKVSEKESCTCPAMEGAEAWENYRRRNDSVVVDQLYGQFKSTCVCPRCNGESVSFEVFNHLSLEIPRPVPLRRMTVLLVTLGSSHSPTVTRYNLSLEGTALVIELKDRLSERSGVPTDRMALCDVYENTIYELIQDNKPLSSIRPEDVLVAYELQTMDVENNHNHGQAIHAVVVHSRPLPRLDLYDYDSSLYEDDRQHRRHVLRQHRFGLPMFVRLPVDPTCRQVWKSLHAQRLYFGDEKPFDVHVTHPDDDHDDDHGTSLPQTNQRFLEFLGGAACITTPIYVFCTVVVSSPEALSVSTSPDDPVDTSDVNDTVVTLDQCLTHFAKPERLDEQNCWVCPKCKAAVPATKTMEVWKLPPVLVVHLKRFGQMLPETTLTSSSTTTMNGHGKAQGRASARQAQKLETLVTCPTEGWDLGPHLSSSSQDQNFVQDFSSNRYDLFAVVDHFGRMGHGHYTATARDWNFLQKSSSTTLSSSWTVYDDSYVRPHRGGPVVTPHAYVLFFKRRTKTMSSSSMERRSKALPSSTREQS